MRTAARNSQSGSDLRRPPRASRSVAPTSQSQRVFLHPKRDRCQTVRICGCRLRGADWEDSSAPSGRGGDPRPSDGRVVQPVAFRRRREKLQKAGSRIVVFLDDFDRLTAPEVREVVRLVKLVGDLPFVTYVLAYDQTRHRTSSATKRQRFSSSCPSDRGALRAPRARTACGLKTNARERRCCSRVKATLSPSHGAAPHSPNAPRAGGRGHEALL